MNTLAAFRVAAHRLNFTHAGEELNITHAAVSNQMKRLEDWFGCKLFNRLGRGLSLTPAGEELLRVVDTSLLSIATTSSKLQTRRERKQISVACLPSIATRWLVPALSEFMLIHPHISVGLSYAEAYQVFDPDSHDILITHLTELPENVTCTRIFDKTSKPVASASYVQGLKRGKDGRFEGVKLLHDESKQAWEEWFNQAGYRFSDSTDGPLYPDFNLLFTAVRAGHGVALCPIEIFRQEIDRGELIILSDVTTCVDQGYYIIAAEQRSRTVDKFIKWFVESLSTPSITSE
jgi:DNA-binding transcriptional LysR family regulator